MDKLLLRVSEAAHICSVSRSVAYELAHTDWHTFTFRVGKSLRVSRAGLEKWVQAKQEEAQGFGPALIDSYSNNKTRHGLAADGGFRQGRGVPK